MNGSDPQTPYKGLLVAQRAWNAVVQRQDLLCLREKHSTCFSKNRLSPASVEQLDGELFLQRFYLQADRGLRQADRIPSTGERPVLNDCH